MKKIQKLAIKVKNGAIFEQWAIDDIMNADEPTSADIAECEQLADMLIAAREELAAEIVRMTRGQIDEPTAYKMTFNPELFDLIARLA